MRRILPSWSRDRVLNIAHRGARAFAPENTQEAIAKAKQLGADMVELDVHLSRDGIAIVMHDDDLTRCTDAQVRFPDRAPWFVSQLTAAEIASLDAGSWYTAQLRDTAQAREPHLREMSDSEASAFVTDEDLAKYESGAVHPPLLREALASARRLDLLINVELKAIPRRYPGLARAVTDMVRELRLIDHVLVASFDHQLLVEVREYDAAIATAVLTQDRLARIATYVRDLVGADAVHPGCGGDSDLLGLDSVSGSIDRATIRECRDAGLLVNAWTENDPSRMRALIGAGVTGIVTDYPNRLALVLEEPGRSDLRP